jgi:predicted DNA-binding transcriptional regulator AlpA
MKMHTMIEVAAAARISHATLHRRIREGAGPRTIRIGRRVLCSEAALTEWLQTP